MRTFRQFLAAWVYQPITQTEARERMKVAAEGLPEPRVIYRESDGREKLTLVYRALKSVLRRVA